MFCNAICNAQSTRQKRIYAVMHAVFAPEFAVQFSALGKGDGKITKRKELKDGSSKTRKSKNSELQMVKVLAPSPNSYVLMKRKNTEMKKTMQFQDKYSWNATLTSTEVLNAVTPHCNESKQTVKNRLSRWFHTAQKRLNDGPIPDCEDDDIQDRDEDPLTSDEEVDDDADSLSESETEFLNRVGL